MMAKIPEIGCHAHMLAPRRRTSPPRRAITASRKSIHLLCFLALPGAAVLQRHPLRYPAPAILLRRLRTVDQRIRHRLLLPDVSDVRGGAVVGDLRPCLLRLSLPADDLQRSLAGAGGLAAPQDQQARCPAFSGTTPRIAGAARSTCVLAAVSVVLAFIFISYFVEPRDLLAPSRCRSICTPPAASPAPPSRCSRFSISPWCGSASAPPSAPTATCRACWATTTPCWWPIATRRTTASNARNACASARWGSISANRRFRSSASTAASASTPASTSCSASASGGLIHYAWGEHGEATGRGPGTPRRDAKRGACWCWPSTPAGLFVALSMRRSVLVQLQPDRSHPVSRRYFRRRVQPFPSEAGESQPVAAIVSVFGWKGCPARLSRWRPNPLPLRRGRYARSAVRNRCGAASRARGKSITSASWRRRPERTSVQPSTKPS